MRIENTQVLMKDGVFRRASVDFTDTIQKVELSPTIDASVDGYLIPGLIDVHTHGALGGDHTDGCPDKMQEMSKFYAKNGTTSFMATTLTDTEETIAKAMSNITAYKQPQGGARCIGINMEGPFFSHPRRGAHQAELLQAPTLAMFERLYKLSGEKLNLVCVAPELDGAQEFIKEVSKLCRVSLAHSAADYDTAVQAFENGATLATHLFNGMEPFLHRAPGIIGAAMDSDAFVEVICDGNHLHPAVIRAIFRMFPQRVCLISDSLRCAGLPDGDYESAGLPVTVTGGKCMLRDGSSLAGSTITLLQGVRIAVSIGIPLAQAVMAASASCAKMMGMDDKMGTISPGKYADMILLDKDLNIKKVYVGGKEI